MALYDSIGKVYDMIYSDDTSERIPFVVNLLNRYAKKNILELGSGSGLFAIPLKKQGFNTEGVEISKEMIQACHDKYPDLKVHLGNICDYSLNKQFDAILALSSLMVILKGYEDIYQCLKCTHEHLKHKGILLIELPNHNVEVKKCNNSQEVFHNDDFSEIVVIQSFKGKEYWCENWDIFKKSSNGLNHEQIVCKEFLYDPDILEKGIEQRGFKILERYGDLLGNQFDPETSWRRVFVCQKT